jgi:hypothetical protein
MKLGTLTLSEAASLAGRAIGPAITTAANSIVAMVVNCMVTLVGLWVVSEWRVI